MDTPDLDRDFFDALISDGQPKIATELDSETAEALGIQTVSPRSLELLEEQVSQSQAAESEEDQPQPEAAAEAVEVKKFERKDSAPDTVRPPEPELPSRTTHGKLFTDKRSHPLQLLEVLTLRYKTSWVEWESDTLWWSLRKSFGSVGEVVRNKIMALRLAATTDMPWLDWDVFEDSGLAWNDIVPTIGSFQPMTPMQVAFSVSILNGIRPGEEFSHEVRAYIAAILDEHGWVWAPPEYFGDVQEILERSREHLTGLKQDVISAWEKVQGVDPQSIDWTEDPLSIHLLKLFTVKTYLDSRAEAQERVLGIPSSSSTISPPVP